MTLSRAVVGTTTTKAPSGTLVLVPDQNLRTGIAGFADVYPDCTSLEKDLLVVASAVYACDLAFKRGEREKITRDIALTVPVVNHQAFVRLKEKIEVLLWTLSSDNWTITFRRDDGTPEVKTAWPSNSGVTTLFSGGADSFVAAVDLLQQHGTDGVQLVSHVTGNPVTHRSQDELADHLIARFGAGLKRLTLRTGGRNRGRFTFPSDAQREDTQRTRTFMFLAIAALAARRTGHNKLVVIPENGQMAIHIPLSPARIGAFSTHTAHPEFVALAKEFFCTLLDVDYEITNPYLYATKAEVVARLSTADRPGLCKSVSCWRGARVPSYDHCGECIPCLVRRVAFEVNGIALAEYRRDLFAVSDILALNEDDEGKRNLVEFAEFVHTFRSHSEATLVDLFPDLINPYFDQGKALSLYQRSALEGETILRRYAGPAALLPPAPPPRAPSGRKGKAK